MRRIELDRNRWVIQNRIKENKSDTEATKTLELISFTLLLIIIA